MKIVFITVFFLVVFADAARYLHRGKASLSKDVVLRGHTLTDSADSLNIQPGLLPKLSHEAHKVDFYVHIERDVVVWDELSESGARLQCFKSGSNLVINPIRTPRPITGPGIGKPFPNHPLPIDKFDLDTFSSHDAVSDEPKVAVHQRLSAGYYRLVVTGAGIDTSDFPTKSVLVINNEDWEDSCKTVIEEVAGVDEEDDTLFLEILSSKTLSSSSVSINVKRISGDGVAPIVDVDVHHETTTFSASPKSVQFDRGTFTVASKDIHAAEHFATNETLETSVRPSFSYNNRVPIGSLGHMDLNARVSAGVTRFRFVRLRGLKFKWEQYLHGSFKGNLLLNGAISPDPWTGPIFRYWIPKLSISARIPFIARLKAGAFLGVNWITEIDLKVRADIKFDLRYNRREEVNAQLLPPRYSARNLLSPSSGSSGSADVQLSGSYNGAKFTGFAGVRPQIGVGIEYKRRKWFKWKTSRIDGNVGANVGIEVFAGVKLPPYAAYSGSGKEIGSCDKCHSMQGRLSVKGKKLSAQLVVNNRVKKEAVFVHHLFEIRIGTLCALPTTCGLLASPTPSPTPTRTPRPVIPLSYPCGPCGLHRRCPSNYICRSRKCYPTNPTLPRCRPRLFPCNNLRGPRHSIHRDRIDRIDCNLVAV